MFIVTTSIQKNHFFFNLNIFIFKFSVGIKNVFFYINYLTVFSDENVKILILHCKQLCTQNFSETECWEVH